MGAVMGKTQIMEPPYIIITYNYEVGGIGYMTIKRGGGGGAIMGKNSMRTVNSIF